MADSSGDFAQALRGEILRSEQQRMKVIASILVFILCFTTIGLQVLPELRQAPVSQRHRMVDAAGGHRARSSCTKSGPSPSSAGACRAGKDFPQPARFVNALIETSLPGVIIYALARHMEPQLVFGFWPPMLYFVFIVLSTLRLDFWLSLWTGAVAAVQQFALALWLLPLAPPANGRKRR